MRPRILSAAITCGTPAFVVARENDDDLRVLSCTAIDISLCHPNAQLRPGGLSKNNARTSPKQSPNSNLKKRSRLSHCQTVRVSGIDLIRFRAAYTWPPLERANAPSTSCAKTRE